IKLTGRRLEDTRFVVNGAGAAGIACIEFYIAAGARRDNVMICDSKGVVYRGRTDGMTPEKQKLAAATPARTLAEAMRGADLFVGLSVADCVTADMIRTMAPQPIIFAMANPNPEIYPAAATAAGAAVVCTGRSDFPNQVNNVLGFPGIFRGALDTRARTINEEMKAAASRGLAELAGETIPSDVLAYLTAAYPEDAKNGVFAGTNPLKTSYVIPKPFDPRVVPRVARHVAEAAMNSGVAAKPLADLAAYERSVRARVDATLKGA
ncbi:MAG: malic enzyme-like NAD(P)-binding protein, partial [bacterium]